MRADVATRDESEALAAEATVLLRVFAPSPDPLVLTDREGRIRALHAGSVPVAWPPLDRPLLPQVSEGFRAEATAGLHASAQGRARTFDLAFPLTTGGRAWFRATLSPVQHEEKVIGVLWTLADITDRYDEVRHLRLTGSMMTDAQGVAHIGTWEWDPTQEHATWSLEMHRIYGTDPATHVPTYDDYLTRVHAEDRDRVRLATEAVFQHHEPYSHDERILRPDGSIRWLHTWAQPIRDEAGRIVRLLGVCQDITERKLAELEVDERLREKEVLLKEVHHRVKNNLQVVASLLTLQAAASEARPDLKASLDEARDRVRSMALVHETLYASTDLSRIDFGTYVADLARDIQHAYAGETDRVMIAVIGREVPVSMERAVNAGLLVNELLTNAVKHAFPGERAGTIRVTVERDGEGGIRLSVADDGIGMPAGDPKGLPGLGLQLVRALLRQMEGTIEWHADRGTRVDVHLPPQPSAS